MNKKFKSVMIASSTLAVLASLIPMASYAVTDTANVSVKVSPYITIDATAPANIGSDTEGVTPNTLAKGTFSATVTANKGYTLSLHATQPNLTSAASDAILAIAAGGTSSLPAGTTAWGVQKQADATANNGVYTGLTTSPVEFFRSATAADKILTSFNVGIMVTPSIPSGTYSTDVTITASTI